MTQNKAAEKLRIVDVIKENTGLVLSIGGFIWLVFQFLILPMQEMRFQINNILDNHLATIQTELTSAKSERDKQGKQLITLSEQIIRLQILIEKN